MSDHQDGHQDNRLLKSGFWAIAGRWSIKFLGLMSTLFVVRLLLPQDFGIIMKLMMVTAPINVIVGIGFSETLIITKKLTRQHYDTAFTLNISSAIFLCLTLFFLTPVLASLVKEPLLNQILPIFLLKICLLGFVNPRRLEFQRNFEYVKDFKFSIYHKLCHIACIVGFSFYFRNYNGLLYGQIGGAFAMVVLSYTMITYRPRLSLRYVKQFLSFSYPNLSAGVGENILMNLDRLLLVRFLNNTVLGFYNLAYELAEQFTTEIIYPLARGFFPVFSEIAEDKTRLKAIYLDCISFLIPLCLAIGIGLSMISKPLIAIYAGPVWKASAPLLGLLALSAAAQAFSLVSATVLGATGAIKKRAWLITSNAIVTAIVMLPFVLQKNLEAVLIVKCCISLIFVFLNIAIICQYLKIALKEIYRHSIRPLCAAMVMYGVLGYIQFSSNITALIGMVLVGALTFVSVHYLLWLMIGKPDTIEKKIYLRFFPPKKIRT